MESIIHFLTENILIASVIAMLAVLLLLRYIMLLGKRTSWQTLYAQAQEDYPNIARWDSQYSKLYPNMPLDIRVYHVSSELRQTAQTIKSTKAYEEHKAIINVIIRKHTNP